MPDAFLMRAVSASARVFAEPFWKAPRSPERSSCLELEHFKWATKKKTRSALALQTTSEVPLALQQQIPPRLAHLYRKVHCFDQPFLGATQDCSWCRCFLRKKKYSNMSHSRFMTWCFCATSCHTYEYVIWMPRSHHITRYRVAETHGIPYLYRSFSAKEPYNQWLFCGKWLATSEKVGKKREQAKAPPLAARPGILWVFTTLYDLFVRVTWCIRNLRKRERKRGGTERGRERDVACSCEWHYRM